MTDPETSQRMVRPDTRTIGNDENDVRCDLCGRKGWFVAVEVTFEAGARKIVCQDRYEGESCIDVLLAQFITQGV